MGQKQQLIWDLPALDSLKINAAIYGISDKVPPACGRVNEMLSLHGNNQPVPAFFGRTHESRTNGSTSTPSQGAIFR